MAQLRIPGPTPLPDEVLTAISRQMVNHRGVEFKKMLQTVTEKLQQAFQTKNDLYLLTGSGTGGMEAAVVNTLSPGDRVLCVSIGAFGDRFINIAKAFGADVVALKTELGKAADPEEIRKALAADPKIKAVLVTHNETSTGVTNPLEKIAGVVKGAGKLLLVDCISSLGSINVPVDEWGIDVAVSGSQKGWMVPPGMVFASVSKEAWQANATAKMPRFYWDFGKAKTYWVNAETPWTPAVSVVFGLNVALDMMFKEGLQNIFARHARVGQAARDGVKSLGLKLLADEKFASNTVTAVWASDGIEQGKLNRIMREQYQIELAGGQASLEGKIFRIGHLGLVTEKEIKEVISALKLALPQAGFKKEG